MNRMDNLLILNSISKEYVCGNNKIYAVRDINLKVDSGKSISITGPSGCGKSTLLNIIGNITKPTSGSIILDNRNTNSFSKNELSILRNKFFGYISQNYLLIDGYSVFENVEIPLIYSKRKISKIEKEKRIIEVLRSVNLEDKIHEDIKNLSGGQQQRVAIARALVNNPKIILADEPTGALDTKSGREVMNLLLTLVKNNKTLIIVTHNEDLAKECDIKLNMKDGVIL